jgi:pyrroline-5-carboxylate reductase
MSFFESILLVGCGNMGRALLAAWRGSGVSAASIRVIEPNQQLAEKATRGYGVEAYESLAVLPAHIKPDCVVFAVKPVALDTVLPAYGERFGPHTNTTDNGPLYISVAAGKQLGYFANKLGAKAAVIRTMPSVLAEIGRGVTAATQGQHVTSEQRENGNTLLACQGDVVWVDEAQMDAVTAISGSGPAYAFYFMEAMVQAAIDLGLHPGMAKTLVLGTVRGAADLASQSTESLESLRSKVVSPAGTTEAALQVLMSPDHGFQPILRDAVTAAVARAKELAAA